MCKILIIVVFKLLIIYNSILLYKVAMIQKFKGEPYKIEATTCELSNIISQKLQ